MDDEVIELEYYEEVHERKNAHTRTKTYSRNNEIIENAQRRTHLGVMAKALRDAGDTVDKKED